MVFRFDDYPGKDMGMLTMWCLDDVLRKFVCLLDACQQMLSLGIGPRSAAMALANSSMVLIGGWKYHSGGGFINIQCWQQGEFIIR